MTSRESHGTARSNPSLRPSHSTIIIDTLLNSICCFLYTQTFQGSGCRSFCHTNMKKNTITSTNSTRSLSTHSSTPCPKPRTRLHYYIIQSFLIQFHPTFHALLKQPQLSHSSSSTPNFRTSISGAFRTSTRIKSLIRDYNLNTYLTISLFIIQVTYIISKISWEKRL